MVVIRLARHGAHKAPFYRVVVADQRKRRDGSFIELVGTYDPKLEPSGINLDMDKINAWIAKGAQPSERVAKLIAIVNGTEKPAKIQAREQLKAAEKAAAEKAAAEETARKAAEEASAAAAEAEEE